MSWFGAYTLPPSVPPHGEQNEPRPPWASSAAAPMSYVHEHLTHNETGRNKNVGKSRTPKLATHSVIPKLRRCNLRSHILFSRTVQSVCLCKMPWCESSVLPPKQALRFSTVVCECFPMSTWSKCIYSFVCVRTWSRRQPKKASEASVLSLLMDVTPFEEGHFPHNGKWPGIWCIQDQMQPPWRQSPSKDNGYITMSPWYQLFLHRCPVTPQL